MRLEEEIVAAPALRCGTLLLVPLVRVRVRTLAGFAGLGEAELAALLVAPRDGRPFLLAPDADERDAPSWSELLSRDAALLAAIRARLGASSDA